MATARLRELFAIYFFTVRRWMLLSFADATAARMTRSGSIFGLTATFLSGADSGTKRLERPVGANAGGGWKTAPDRHQEHCQDWLCSRNEH